MAAPNSHSKMLFVTRDGVPMRFYVRPGPNKRQLAPLITHGGGVVCRIQEPGAFLLADPTEDQLGSGYISTSFITDCVSCNRSLSPRAYRLLPSKTGTGLLRNLTSRFSTVQWGESEDHKGKPTVVPTNNAEAAVQDQRENGTTSVTTRDGATGEREDNMEQMGNRISEWAQEDDQGHKGSSVDLADKEEADAQGNSEATTEKATGDREDNGEKKVFTSSRMDHGDKEGYRGRSAVDLTNKEEAITQGNSKTCTSMVATTEKATGEREDDGEKGFSMSKKACGDKESHKGSSAVELTNKEEADAQGNWDTSMMTTGEREDNIERMTRASRKESSKSPASKSIIPTKPASECRDHLKTDMCTASSTDGTCVEATEDKRGEKNTGGVAASHSTSRTQRKPLSLGQMDVEQSLNVDENYSSIIIPDPRTSTPAPWNPNTVKDSEADTTDDGGLMKDGESHLGTQFRRPKRKVASITRFGDGGNQHSPDMKQSRAEKTNIQENPRNEMQMSVDEKHCGPVEESHSAESPAGQMEHPKAETGSQKKYTAKELDGQSEESQQVQAVISLQGHKEATTLRKGRIAFTNEEDVAILVYIRDNASSSCTVTGNVLWKDMEKKKVLRRTWQAMKARYAKYLVNHKYKYKLPPKCSTSPRKKSSSKSMHRSDKTNGSWLTCALTSTITPKNCDDIQPSAPADIPQNCDTTQPSASADIPQNCDTTQPRASADIPQNCNAIKPSVSANIPQNCDTTQPSALANIPQICDTTHIRAPTNIPQNCGPSAPTDIPQNCDTTHPSVLTDISQNCNIIQPSASADILQNCDSTQPSASADVPQTCDPTQPSASADVPQTCDPTQSSAPADIPQNCDTTQPCATRGTPRKNGTMPPTSSAITPQKADTMPHTSAVTPQNCVTMLPGASTDTHQKNDTMPPTASAVTPKTCGTILPSASSDTPQKSDIMLPSTSADTHLNCNVTQHKAFTSANTLVTNIASKEQSVSTPRKRSSDAKNDDESSTQEKGNKMLPSPHSSKTVRPDREDSSDSEDLHIFEAANLEFEETDDNTSPEQAAPVVSQTENKNSASHVDETPSTSQASESEGLQEAVIDMMREFKLDVSHVTQALFFNSGELGSTRHFLRTGSRPDGYPIWEPKDDLDLKKNNPKMQSHLIKKYGADNVARRVAFLAS